MKPRQIVDEMDSYVPGRSQDEIAQEFNLNKDEIIKLGSMLKLIAIMSIGEISLFGR